MADALKIKAKRNGYRRAGYGFSDKVEKVIPLADLSKEQVKALKEDPHLIVSEATTKESKPAGDDKPNKPAGATK